MENSGVKPWITQHRKGRILGEEFKSILETEVYSAPGLEFKRNYAS